MANISLIVFAKYVFDFLICLHHFKWIIFWSTNFYLELQLSLIQIESQVLRYRLPLSISIQQVNLKLEILIGLKGLLQ